jgi:RNA polymerase primary sigma factor
MKNQPQQRRKALSIVTGPPRTQRVSRTKHKYEIDEYDNVSNFDEVDGDELIYEKEIVDTKGKDRYICKIAHDYNPLAHAETVKIFMHLEKHPNSKAVRKLILIHNQRLIITVAKRYLGKGLDLEDLVQEGNLGLLYAIPRFDYKRGFKLSTYVTHWIREYIEKAIAKCKTVNPPVSMLQKYSKVQKAYATGYSRLQRPLTTEELAKETGLTVQEVENFKKICWDIESLDEQLSSDSDATLGDTIADNRFASPEAQIEMDQKNQLLNSFIDKLPPEDARFIRRAYGLGGTEERTTYQMSQLYSCTEKEVKARIQRIQNELQALIDPKLFEDTIKIADDQAEIVAVVDAVPEPEKCWKKVMYGWQVDGDNSSLLIKETRGCGDKLMSINEIVLPAALAEKLIEHKTATGFVMLEV